MPQGPDRRFSRDETQLILSRATEGERAADELEGGLTLEEIVAAAREAGIDPAAVRRAAALATLPGEPARGGPMGAPVTPALRARFDGRLPESAYPELHAAVERAVGRRGELTQDAAGVTWHEDHGFGRTTVQARQEGGAVVVSAEADRRGHLLALVLGLATLIALALPPLGGFGGLAALGGPLAVVLAPLAALLAGTRVAWPLLERPTHRRLEQAVIAIGALVDPQGAAGELPGGPATRG